jgi:Uncharacterized protein conserved in bacteria (DUF2188)
MNTTLKLRPGTTPRARRNCWIVWKDGGSRPRRRHDSLTDALAEATRLAALHPGAVLRTYRCELVNIKQEDAP